MRCLLVSALLVGGSAFAQEPDSLDPRGYFPLAVGNEWEYEVRHERPWGPYRPTDESWTEYLRFRVIGAGSGDLADRFTLVEERFAEGGAVLARDTAIVWYDAESASVLTTDVRPNGTPYEHPAPPFAADLDLPGGDDDYGEWSWSGAYYIDEVNVEFGVPAFVREPLAPVVAKEFFNLGGGVAIAVHGFGFVYDALYPDGCSKFCSSDAATLTFAVVDGQAFGVRAVGVEVPLERVAPGPLVVYPNPTSGRVTVEAGFQSGSLQGVRRVTVFDTAGRLVHSVPSPPGGVANLDLGGLSPGLYLLRAGTQIGRVVVH